MTTAEYNADNPFAMLVAAARQGRTNNASYVLCPQLKSFDWRLRSASPHPFKRLGDTRVAEACARLNQIVQLA